jgi:hypothetical protein
MELVARRFETWKECAAATGACVLSLGLGSRVQALTGNAGVLLGLLLATAVASWYAGRWAGFLTTGVGAVVASYFFLPPLHSLRIFEPRDSGALYSFAIGGVIISLLCGAAWQLRAEARFARATEEELARLRSVNARLHQRTQQQDARLAASERLLQEFARSARAALEDRRGQSDFAKLACQFEQIKEASPQLVDCNTLWSRRSSLPTVWADEGEMRKLFEILALGDLSASELPEWWLFVAVFRNSISPLPPIQHCTCERIIARQGGRSWSNITANGSWELRFLMPRHRT